MSSVKQKHGLEVGDLVKHQYGTLQGSGIVLTTSACLSQPAKILWTAHGQTKVFNMLTRYLEVV